jgi:hypothetical protein
MESGGGKDHARGEGAVSFAHALDTLKQHGSALLVVGSVPDGSYVDASMRMLGDPTADPPRRRLLVVPEFDRGNAMARLNDARTVTPEWTRIVVHDATARSATASAGTAAPGPGAADRATEVVDGDITNLGATVSTVIEEFDRAANGLESAELRMAFDCLPALLTEYDEETVFRFLHLLTYHVRQVSGMSHFWLPRDPTNDVTQTLAPLFDAIIELRIDGGVLKQRWNFRDMDLVSDWLPITR